MNGMVLSGKIGKSFDRLLGKPNNAMDWDIVRKINGECVVDPLHCHEAVSKHFEEWHGLPTVFHHLKRTASQWDDMFQSEQRFIDINLDTMVPIEHLRVLWNSLHVYSTNEAFVKVKERLAAELSDDTPHTFDEFRKQIIFCKGRGKGAGLSGISYTALNHLPPKILKQLYNYLALTWRNDNVPVTWKWRWLAPIPKKVNPTLNDLRPICLMECLRKVWHGMTTYKIKTALQDNGLLSEGQNGYLTGRGATPPRCR
jgi:hypothetical protein